ncbi:MAG: site-specific integrase [Bacteroidales bacterium]|jgi:integrase|nr:site-specific integrase [Bacteroidales bacterium]MDD4215176.1 site-specific integrase [Bacteroidales bacterium]
MANIRIFLRTNRIILKDKHPVVLILTIEGKRKYFSLGGKNKGYACTQNEWDFEKNRFKKNHDKYKIKNQILDNLESQANDIFIKAEYDKIPVSFEYFTKQFSKKTKKYTVFTFFDEEIERLKKSGSLSYSDTFKATKSIINKFCDNENLKFTDVDYNFLKRFETYCFQHKAKSNTVSVYMRTFRTLFNSAIKNEICFEVSYPFKSRNNPNGYSLEHLNTETQKRAITLEQMKLIINYKVKKETDLFHAKNIFLFSFYAIGINFIDMANLKWNNIINNRIEYNRAKTGGQFSILIQPELKKIIDYYKKNKKSDYILPIFNDTHVTALQKYNRKKKMLRKFNSDLQTIAENLGIDFNITSYVSRHSWATIQKEKGTPTAIISEGLGHKTEAITQTYLKKFENSVLDEANRNLLKKLQQKRK